MKRMAMARIRFLPTSRPMKRRGKRTLSLRTWLILAVSAIICAGFLAQFSLTLPVSLWEQQAAAAQLTDVRQIIGADAAQWSDPAWQQHTAAQLAAQGVEVALFPARSTQSALAGQAIFMTDGARRILDTSGQNASGPAAQQTLTGTDQLLSAHPVFQRIVITNPARSGQQQTVGVAFLWATSPTPGALLGLLWAVVELGTFALTLALVVWLMGLPVLRPLAEMSQAVEAMAGGDLKAHLPWSPVREIADVSAALDGMSAALQDALTRQAALEEERRMFVGAVAHDLRTPLFMLRGHLKGLEDGVAASPEKISHYVAICQAQANVLDRLVSDLFAYTRLEHLELEPERNPLALGTLLCQTVEAAKPLAAARGIALSVNVASSGDAVAGDSHLLIRAVENLLDNALRHTPDGGEVCVRLTRNQERLIFTVADSGPGIATHDLPHLFTPLYRGEASRNRQTGGAGLGLAIARRILEAHGGTLTAANRPEGGAIFTAGVPATSRGEVAAGAYHLPPAQ